MNTATRLGEALLRAPKLTQAEVRTAIEAARVEHRETHRQRRLRMLVDEMGLTVRLTARNEWDKDLRKLAVEIVETIDAATKQDK